ncbi:hypothetical protein I204_04651 [Kwoniella mangroviensis CBS 8886]|nr:hypothetical protein I204_04651 [Kwoniella mangroviensis CBS 8886]
MASNSSRQTLVLEALKELGNQFQRHDENNMRARRRPAMIAIIQNDRGRFTDPDHRSSVRGACVDNAVDGMISNAVSCTVSDDNIYKSVVDVNKDHLDFLHAKYLQDNVGDDLKDQGSKVQPSNEFCNEFISAVRSSTQREFCSSTVSKTSVPITAARVALLLNGTMMKMLGQSPKFVDSLQEVETDWRKSLDEREVSTEKLEAMYLSERYPKSLMPLYGQGFKPDPNTFDMVLSIPIETNLTFKTIKRMITQITSEADQAERNADARTSIMPRPMTSELQVKHQADLIRREESYWQKTQSALESTLSEQSQMSDEDWKENGNLHDVVYSPDQIPGTFTVRPSNGPVVDLHSDIEVRFWQSKNPSSTIEDPYMTSVESLNERLEIATTTAA